jgi:2-hydroxy-6-oxonona-2,4-dienedioate hydrolase
MLDRLMTPPEIAALEASATRHATPCGEGQMAWREWNAGAAHTVVLFHGGFGSWMHFARCIPALAAQHRVLAADLPGLGWSDAAPEPYSAESLTAIVLEGVRRLVPEKFTLAGFSFGGLIGGHVAAALGPHVEKFVFVGPGGLGLPRGTHEPLLQWRKLGDDAAVRAIHGENLRRFMFRDASRIDDTAVWIQTENTRRARTKSRPIAGTDTLARKLPDVVAPMIGAWGDRDMTAWPYLDQRQAMMRDVGARYVEIADCGHWAPYEQPEACVALITA